MHVVGYMTMLSPLKPYLTGRVDLGVSDVERSLQTAAVDCSLKITRASHRFSDCICPSNSKFHFAVFIIFHTFMIIAAAFYNE